MDFICLEAGCYPSILHPSSPRMLPQPLEMEVTLSWYIHISSCRPLWLRERKCLGTKSLSVSGEVSQPSSPVPSHLPSSFHVQCFLPSTSSASCLWHHLPSDSPIQQHFSSQDPDQVSPLLGRLADHPCPLECSLSWATTAKLSVLQWVPFIATILEFLTDLSSVPSWLLNWSVGSPKAEGMLPSPYSSLWFMLDSHIE